MFPNSGEELFCPKTRAAKGPEEDDYFRAYLDLGQRNLIQWKAKLVLKKLEKPV